MRDVPPGQYALDADAWWLWPKGHCLCIPARKLAALTRDDLKMLAENEHPFWWAHYDKEAVHNNYHALGHLPADAMSEFRRDPGVNREKRWRAYAWREPPNHLAPCWWITNGWECDAPPELLQCSLVELSCRVEYVTCPGVHWPGAYLREKYHMIPSGILADDQRTLEHLVAQDEEEDALQAKEAIGLGVAS